MIWRIVLDPRVPDGLAAMRAAWCLDDIVHCSDLLDQLDLQSPGPDGDGRATVRVDPNAQRPAEQHEV